MVYMRAFLKTGYAFGLLFAGSLFGTYAVSQDFLGLITTDRLIGRDTAGTGQIEELTVGGGLEFTGSGGIQRSALTGDITASAGSGATDIDESAVEAEIEPTLDTLANLTNVQSLPFTLADAGANVFFGWDDVAGAYENLTSAEAEAIVEPLLDTLANLTSVQGFPLLLTDDNLDVLFGWDDSDGQYESLALAEIVTEAAPAAGDFVVLYGAEGDLRKVNWSSLPGVGGGIANVVEDLTPQLGGPLETNSFAIEFGAAAATDTSVVRSSAGDISIEGNVVYRAGGTDVALADGGTGASLVDPNADRLFFWDDSAGATDWLTVNAPLAITTTSIDINAATDTTDGSVELATTAEAETGTDTTRAVTAAGVLAAIAGKHTIYVPAGAMISETTTGCAAGTVETPTNLVMYKTMDCDGATQEGVQFTFKMPKSADEGTVTMALDWTNASGTGDTVWLFSCLARSNDDPIEVAFGTEISVTDTVLSALDVHVTAESAAITAGGTPAESDMWWCRVQRDADIAGDTLNAVDAKILGVRVLYSINAYTDD